MLNKNLNVIVVLPISLNSNQYEKYIDFTHKIWVDT